MMKTKAVLLTLVFSLLSIAAVTSVSAATPVPRRDHADAVYFYKSSVRVVSSMIKKLDSSQQEALSAVDGCPDAFVGASQEQIRDAEDTIANILFVQHILPDYASLKTMLVKRKAKNAVLKTIARNVVVINGQINKYHRLGVDTCQLGREWSANSWDANYLDTWTANLDTLAGFSAGVVTNAAVKIASQRTALTKRFDLTATQVKIVINVTTFFSR